MKAKVETKETEEETPKHTALMQQANVVTGKDGVNVKGNKKYLMVKDRIIIFREGYGTDFGIETTLLHADEKFVRVRATVTDDQGRVIGSGLAEELRGIGVNKSSALENCETSAIGRSLASLGLHGGEYPTYDEIEANKRGDEIVDELSMEDIEPEEKPAIKKKTPAKEVVKQAKESKVVENIKENFPGAEIQQVTDLGSGNIYNEHEELIFGFDDETLQFVVDEDHDAKMQKGLFSETIPHVLTVITDQEDLLKLWNNNHPIFKELGEKTGEDWLQFDFVKAIGRHKRQLAE